MHLSGRSRSGAASLALATLAAVLLLAASGADAAQSKRVVKKVHNAALDQTILTTLGGRTLYSLSAERRGRFICTSRSCLALWRPLLVRRGVRPRGPVKLGAVERPDGRTQVTYRGRPLYRFDGDGKPGQVNGHGFRDVGTWRAAKAPPARSREPQPEPPTPEPAPPTPEPAPPTPEPAPQPPDPYPSPY